MKNEEKKIENKNKNKTDDKKDPKNTDHTRHRAFSFGDAKT